MVEQVIAYYPGITPAYKDSIILEDVNESGTPTGITRVSVLDDPRLDFDLLASTKPPVRKYTAYFMKIGGCPVRVCNVDLELEIQPDVPTVARAILTDDPIQLLQS
jgi:hypothetical protein